MISSPNPAMSDGEAILTTMKILLDCLGHDVKACVKEKLQAEVTALQNSGPNAASAQKIQGVMTTLGLL